MNTTLLESTQKPVFAPLAPTAANSLKRNWRKRALTALVGLFGVAAAGAAGWKLFSKPEAAAYGTAGVKRGDLTRTISATVSPSRALLRWP